MRISDLKLLGDTISSALSAAFHAGMKAEAKVPGSNIVYDSTGALNDLLLAIDRAGFDIGAKTAVRPDVIRVPKNDAGRVETRTPAHWVLASVMPGVVDIRPSSTVRDHVIEATATALLTRGDFSERREIKVRTAWFCNEESIEEATREAVTLALWQARKGAAAFIAATASDPAPTPGEVA